MNSLTEPRRFSNRILSNISTSWIVRPLMWLAVTIGGSAVVSAEDAVFADAARRLAEASFPGVSENAALQAEQSAIRAEVAPEDPEVEFEYLWPSATGERNRWSAGISQQIPDFRKMAASRKIIRAIDTLKIHKRMAADADAYFEAQTKLINLIGARRELILLQEIHANLDSLEIVYNRAWEKGEVTILDLNKIRIEHARASAANDEAEATVRALTAEIIALSGGVLSAGQLDRLIDYPMFPAFPYDHGCLPGEGEMAPVVMASSQYKVLEAETAVAYAKYNMASKERFPKLTLGYVHAYEDGNHFNGLSAGLTLPVYSRKSTEAAAAGECLALKVDNEIKKNEMIAGANSDCAKAHILERRLSMLGPAVENTNNVRLLKMALEGGEISLLEYLQETSYFVEAAREYNAARLEYALVLASLSRWTYNKQCGYVPFVGGNGDGVKL